MESNNVLKLVYTFFLGLLLAIFIGVGINTFYPGPTMPEQSTALTNSYNKEPAALTSDQKQLQNDYNNKMDQYNKDTKSYSRNVSILALVAAVLFLVISLLYEKRIRIISDGLLLGGLFTLIYSIIRSFASSDSKYIFGVVTAGLIIVIYLGYRMFVLPHNKSDKPVVS